MWLFTKYGFFSVVCARVEDRPGAAIDPDKMMIRSRHRFHLEKLKSEFPELKAAKIWEDVGSDYRYRIFMSRDQWISVADQLANRIDYDNFKSSISPLARWAAYGAMLHEVWGLVYSYRE